MMDKGPLWLMIPLLSFKIMVPWFNVNITPWILYIILSTGKGISPASNGRDSTGDLWMWQRPKQPPWFAGRVEASNRTARGDPKLHPMFTRVGGSHLCNWTGDGIDELNTQTLLIITLQPQFVFCINNLRQKIIITVAYMPVSIDIAKKQVTI